MIKVGIIDPQPDSASAFYRSTGPFAYLEKVDGLGKFPLLQNVAWHSLHGCDAVFMRSPVGQHGPNLVKHLLDQGLPVWCDYDDSIDLMPETFPLYMKLGSQTKNVHDIWEMATHLSTSSKVLFKRWTDMGYENKCTIIPNAVDEELIRRLQSVIPPMSKPKTPTVWWRGGQSHYENVAYYLDSLKDIQANFVFQGYDFFKDEPHAEKHASRVALKNPFKEHQYRYIEWKNLPFCFSESMQLNPHVSLVMHNKHLFNESKSNSAWLEAVVAGAISVVPNTPEWADLKGTVKYDVGNKTSFRNAVETAVAIPMEQALGMYTEALEQVKQSYLLGNVNVLRAQVINKLINRL